MDEEQKRAAELIRQALIQRLGELMLANIEQAATLQAMREAMFKRAAEQAK